MDKLSFLSKSETFSVVRNERIDRIEIKEGVVAVFVEVTENDRVVDTYNVGKPIADLPKDTQESLAAIAELGLAWLEERRNPKVDAEAAPL